MAENARKKIEKSEKRSKKGKKGGASDEPPRKKKKGNAGEKLKTAIVKDAEVRSGSKAIFVQPYNLADDCFLKDYQLEGVRWLASLFENGVSGILADEVRTTKEFKQLVLAGLRRRSVDLIIFLVIHSCRWDWEKRFRLLL